MSLRAREILGYVAPAVCVIAAAVLAALHVDGWGWFLLVAVLMS